jgi:hypothetical protein
MDNVQKHIILLLKSQLCSFCCHVNLVFSRLCTFVSSRAMTHCHGTRLLAEASGTITNTLGLSFQFRLYSSRTTANLQFGLTLSYCIFFQHMISVIKLFPASITRYTNIIHIHWTSEVTGFEPMTSNLRGPAL